MQLKRISFPTLIFFLLIKVNLIAQLDAHIFTGYGISTFNNSPFINQTVVFIGGEVTKTKNHNYSGLTFNYLLQSENQSIVETPLGKPLDILSRTKSLSDIIGVGYTRGIKKPISSNLHYNLGVNALVTYSLLPKRIYIIETTNPIETYYFEITQTRHLNSFGLGLLLSSGLHYYFPGISKKLDLDENFGISLTLKYGILNGNQTQKVIYQPYNSANPLSSTMTNSAVKFPLLFLFGFTGKI